MSDDLHEYRLRLRAWLADNVERYEGEDPDLGADISPERVAKARGIQAKLYDAGYAGFTFPKEYGGQGLTLDHERVYLEEIVGYDVPTRLFGVSINILGATVAEFGTHEQKERHVRRILRGEELWLQLLSEPGGGSDLAGLLTSAVRDGDNYVVNGQKIWSSGAHFADFAICPVRTDWDVPKHKGISVLIVDLRSPGIEVRRIKQVNGEAHFCEEFFTDALIPTSNLMGEENEGWRVLRGLLAIEHAWVGRGGAKRPDFRQDVSDMVALAKAQGLADDVGVRRMVTNLHVGLQVQRLVSDRVSQGVARHGFHHDYGSLLKLGNDDLSLRGGELGLGLTGADGLTWDPDDAAGGAWARAYLTSRSAPIGGGTTEILRNNVSEKVLGLPREQSVDRELPFNQVPHN